MRILLLAIMWPMFLVACSSGSSGSSKTGPCEPNQTLTSGQSCITGGQTISINAEGTEVTFNGQSAEGAISSNIATVERTVLTDPGTWTITSIGPIFLSECEINQTLTSDQSCITNGQTISVNPEGTQVTFNDSISAGANLSINGLTVNRTDLADPGTWTIISLEDKVALSECAINQTLTLNQGCITGELPVSVNSDGTQVTFNGQSTESNLSLNNNLIAERTVLTDPGTWTITLLVDPSECVINQTLTSGQSCVINGQSLSVNANGTQVTLNGSISAGTNLSINGLTVNRTDLADPGTWTIIALP